MVTARTTGMIRIDDADLDYGAADGVAAALATAAGYERCVVVDVSTAQRATTAGLARLVVLRRALLATGRDLRLTGLGQQAADLLRINRLGAILPVA